MRLEAILILGHALDAASHLGARVIASLCELPVERYEVAMMMLLAS